MTMSTTQGEASAGMPSKGTITDKEHEQHHRPANPVFTLTVLGAGSATPTLRFHPTAQLLTVGNDYMLIDCGEGTQLRLIEQKIRPSRLRYIFISHLHGDHYFGLPPLLSTLNLAGRTEDLYLFGPRGLDEVLTTIFRVSDSRLGYHIHFQAVDPNTPTLLLDHPQLTVESIPLQHRIDCSGYLFREKTHPRKLIRERLPDDIPVHFLKQLKEGRDILTDEGQIIHAADDVTTPGQRARSYAFCSDTRYVESLVTQLQGVDLLYHEATFLEDNAQRAAEVYHSTSKQAATIAANAGVGRLLIGHFSSRYKQYDPFVNEARTIFPETYIAVEGETISIENWGNLD
jgi:ribonuclease Z